MTLARVGADSTSPNMRSLIALVSPDVLSAMIASALLLDHSQVVSPRIAETLAIGAAMLAVRRTGNVSAALAIGMPVYWLATALGIA